MERASNLIKNLVDLEKCPLPIDANIDRSLYCPIDLSVTNTELRGYRLSDARSCQEYINKIVQRHKAKVAFGGYLEKRKLYEDAARFAEGEVRNIHLGMDFWYAAGTRVVAPLGGRVHSYHNNADQGNYGPTIILQHQSSDAATFYTLYGHLSLASLHALKVGDWIEQGAEFAELGTTDINVGYAPHLHFQLILDLENYEGDYPGVCAEKDLEFYKLNCPDPNFLFGLY